MFRTMCVVLFVLVTLCGSRASAWDYFYDGTVLPNDPLLGSGQWWPWPGMDTSVCSCDGGVLRIDDDRASMSATFYKFAVPTAGTPVTLEARVRVASGAAVIDVGTPSFWTRVLVSADMLTTTFYQGVPLAYSADCSLFRTIRIATDSSGSSQVWLDGVLVAQGRTTVSNQGNLLFGSGSATSDTYWDYVAYSNAFVPVAEPSSLAVILTGLAACGETVRRKRT